MTAAAGGNPFEMLTGLRRLTEAPVTQVEAVVRELAARREQVAAFQAQLAAFDEQLAALEAALQPLVDWGRAWADLQQTMFSPLLPPAGEQGREDRSPPS